MLSTALRHSAGTTAQPVDTTQYNQISFFSSILYKVGVIYVENFNLFHFKLVLRCIEVRIDVQLK